MERAGILGSARKGLRFSTLLTNLLTNQPDKSNNGTLDRQEWGDAMKGFGFGHAVHESFDLLDTDRSGSIAYTELEAKLPKYSSVPLVQVRHSWAAESDVVAHHAEC